ncbi:MAG: hypothetical protein Kow00124_07400 [Anaerolineae bacterium]
MGRIATPQQRKARLGQPQELRSKRCQRLERAAQGACDLPKTGGLQALLPGMVCPQPAPMPAFYITTHARSIAWRRIREKWGGRP